MTNYDFLHDYVNGIEENRVHGHLLQLGNELYNYSTLICTLTGGNADLNVRKYSRTTSKIQSELRRLLDNAGYTICEYEGGACTYWNFGYMGAENWTKADLKNRGII